MRLLSPQLGQGKQTGQCDMCWSGSRETWILVPTLLPSVSASQESTFFNPGFSHSIFKKKKTRSVVFRSYSLGFGGFVVVLLGHGGVGAGGGG